MNRIKKVIRCFTTLLAHPSRLARILEDADDWKLRVSQKYGCPNGLSTIDLTFEETIYPYTFLEGTSMLTDIALLKSLASRYEHCTYLEIGTWRGESVANVASVAEECITISLSEEEMRQAKFSEEVIRNHAIFSREMSNVTHIGHNSRTFDFSSLGKKFDLIFIDGEHSYEAIKSDTRNAFRLLKDESSAIVWHDYSYGPEVVRWSVLAGILDGCPRNAQGSIYHVSNTMCAIYLQGSFEESYPVASQLPDKVFTVNLSAKRWTNK
jgi:predicted O-methyltransferase YrrM